MRLCFNNLCLILVYIYICSFIDWEILMKHLIFKNVIYFKLDFWLSNYYFLIFIQQLTWAWSLFYKFNCWANWYLEEGKKKMHRHSNLINIERSLSLCVVFNLLPLYLECAPEFNYSRTFNLSKFVALQCPRKLPFSIIVCNKKN